MNPAHSGMITVDLVKSFIWFLIKKATIGVGLWLSPVFFFTFMRGTQAYTCWELCTVYHDITMVQAYGVGATEKSP